jgi:hypothetical protein
MQSKKSLVLLSLFIGIIFNFLCLRFSILKIYSTGCGPGAIPMGTISFGCTPLPQYYSGFPLHFYHFYDRGSGGIVESYNGLIYFITSYQFWVNLIFWILLVLIILSLIKYFKIKKV